MNLVILIGRLTRNPEIRVAQTGMAVANFTLAVDRVYKKDGQPSADFINCKAFGNTAEVIEKFLSKGSKVAVQGSWTTGSYENKDGQKVYTNELNVSSMKFLDTKNKQEGAEQAPTEGEPNKDKDGYMNIPDGLAEELPFS